MIILRQKNYTKPADEDNSEPKKKKSKSGLKKAAIGSGIIGAGGLIYGGINLKKANDYKKKHAAKFVKPNIDTTIDEKTMNNLTRKDVGHSRLSLSNEMLLDPRGERFKRMRKVAEDKWGDSLYESHRGNIANATNKESLFDLKNNLEDNFSRERLDNYHEKAKTILKDKADNLNKEEFKEAREKFRKDKKLNLEGFKSSKKKAALGVGLGTAALLTAGGIAISRARKKKKAAKEENDNTKK